MLLGVRKATILRLGWLPLWFLAGSVFARPEVLLTAPAAHTRYLAPATITLSAQASVDAGRSIARVEFRADGELIGTATQAPYSFTWSNVPRGNYTLRARVIDNHGAQDNSPGIAVQVRENQPPQVHITAPGNSQVFIAPAAIPVAIHATDRDDNLARVELFANDAPLTVLTAEPYTFNWANVQAGSYILTARATDDLGLTTTSRPVTVQVNPNTANIPPTVGLTAPNVNQVFSAPANIAISATAADSDGSIAKVDFFVGTTPIGTATAPPYSVTWPNVASGSYSLTAVATDNQGATTISTPVPITVNALPTISLTSPANNATFTAPSDITITANTQDTDGTVAQVEFFNGATLIATRTVAPYSIIWTGVPQGSYNLTARVTDNQGGVATSTAASVTVNVAVAQIYFIHTDHLNTPRTIYNNQQQLVWRWDQADPFGGNPPDENPSGLGTFTCNLRLPGQYFDKETNLHYNYFRDYDPGIGRYAQSDPIGLWGGVNSYLYAFDPLTQIDPYGLMGFGGGGSGNTTKVVPKVRSNCGTGVFTGPQFSFREACETHDRCYDTCGANRYMCDDDFSRLAHGSCPPGDMMCHTLATIYYTLMKFGGMTFSFTNAQIEACKGTKC